MALGSMWEKLRSSTKQTVELIFNLTYKATLIDYEHLLNERIKSKGEIDAFMRLLYVITMY